MADGSDDEKKASLKAHNSHPFRQATWPELALAASPAKFKSPSTLHKRLADLREMVDRGNAPKERDVLVASIRNLTDAWDSIRYWARLGKEFFRWIAVAQIISVGTLAVKAGEFEIAIALVVGGLIAGLMSIYAERWLDLEKQYEGLIADLRKLLEKSAELRDPTWTGASAPVPPMIHGTTDALKDSKIDTSADASNGRENVAESGDPLPVPKRVLEDYSQADMHLSKALENLEIAVRSANEVAHRSKITVEDRPNDEDLRRLIADVAQYRSQTEVCVERAVESVSIVRALFPQDAAIHFDADSEVDIGRAYLDAVSASVSAARAMLRAVYAAESLTRSLADGRFEFGPAVAELAAAHVDADGFAKIAVTAMAAARGHLAGESHVFSLKSLKSMWGMWMKNTSDEERRQAETAIVGAARRVSRVCSDIVIATVGMRNSVKYGDGQRRAPMAATRIRVEDNSQPPSSEEPAALHKSQARKEKSS